MPSEQLSAPAFNKKIISLYTLQTIHLIQPKLQLICLVIHPFKSHHIKLALTQINAPKTLTGCLTISNIQCIHNEIKIVQIQFHFKMFTTHLFAPYPPIPLYNKPPTPVVC